MCQDDYSYLPLGPDGIRLLRLMPCEYESIERTEIQCELFQYPLQDQDQKTHLYEALSYVWGEPGETLPILVNGVRFLVTVNLHAALIRLRDRSLQRILWVDAICINQKDLKEQGQQVQLMAKIYSKARCVIVWLGKETVNTKDALEDIRLAANELTECSKEKNLHAILNLLQLPWFQRIWVR
jgi:Heterokaryon incompatibility protein (HET)